VVPNTGLAAGNYSATVTVSGANGLFAQFGISFTVTPGANTPVYGITLNQTDDYTFPAAITGYGQQTVKSVTVNNTGNQATGALSIALSGTNAASFTLSKTTVNSIAASGSDSFTVVPNTGLAAGNYTATVTVSGGNVTSRSFAISFTVIPDEDTPLYGISLNQSGDYTFTAATVGYGAQTAKSVSVSNAGIQPTGDLTIELSGANSGSFTLNKTALNSIAVNGSDSFTVVPNTGLAIGTYTATVRVSGDATITAKEFDVRFTVNPHDLGAASVTGLVKPVTGAAPGTTAGLNGAAGYTVQSIVWKTGGLDVSGNFAAATAYTATIVLKAGTEYRFTGTITPSVNAGTASAGTINEAGPGNTLTFTVSFPATTGLISITVLVDIDGTLITNQPETTTLSRAAGATLTVEAAAGLTDIQWSLNETDIPTPKGTARSISFAAANYPTGAYTLGLRLKKGGVPYSANIEFTVTD
jgi:hypothetical protein